MLILDSNKTTFKIVPADPNALVMEAARDCVRMVAGMRKTQQILVEGDAQVVLVNLWAKLAEDRSKVATIF